MRAVGKVAVDETRVTKIHPRVEGWIEKVRADFTGARVEKGQALLTIYSPEMLASEEELLLAVKARGILKGSTMAGTAADSETLVAAARKRLELWELSGAQVEEIERTGKTIRGVEMDSPASGYVLARNAFPGQKVTPETELYTVADLSRVWVMADVFEADAAEIRMGQSAVVRLPYEGGRTQAARVNYIQPEVNAATRTLQVRLEMANPGMRMKPEMYVDVDFATGTGERLTVPAEAVLDSGERKTVFVDRGNGYLEPRQVETGQALGDRVEIVKGLKRGERIVTSGTFLVDSESQLKAAAGAMAGMPGMGAAGKAAPPEKGKKMPAMPGMGPEHD